MTNRGWFPENIDRVENLTYVSLERRYLKVQFVKTAMAYIGLMLLPVFLLFTTEDPAGRNAIIICAESVLLAAAAVNICCFCPKHTHTKDSPSVNMTSPTVRESSSRKPSPFRSAKSSR